MVNPGLRLEKTLRAIESVMSMAATQYWVCFGGLYAIVKNNGIIPDNDIDICCRFGSDWKKIVKFFGQNNYQLSKGVQCDIDKNQVMYLGFNEKRGDPVHGLHICLSFWYEAREKLWWCHDTKNDIKASLGNIEVPKSGYYFKGLPKEVLTSPDSFCRAEWPGIQGGTKVTVPLDTGTVLDHCYIMWQFKKQQYRPVEGKVQEDKLESIYHGGACSRYQAHLASVGDFASDKKYDEALKKGSQEYWIQRGKMAKKR